LGFHDPEDENHGSPPLPELGDDGRMEELLPNMRGQPLLLLQLHFVEELGPSLFFELGVPLLHKAQLLLAATQTRSG